MSCALKDGYYIFCYFIVVNINIVTKYSKLWKINLRICLKFVNYII